MRPSLFTPHTTLSPNTTLLLSHLPLSPTLRTHLVFGTSFDVGKTLISAGLIRSALLHDPTSTANYIKPLQTYGSDETFIQQTLSPTLMSLTESLDRFKCRTLYQWDSNCNFRKVSHTEDHPVSDEEVLASLKATLTECTAHGVTSRTMCTTLIETAGGILSPGPASPNNWGVQHAGEEWGWSTQADLYKQLHLPVILIGDGNLGGIGSTISSIESLVLRGYNVHGIVMVEKESGKGNAEALKEYFDKKYHIRCGDGRPLFRDLDRDITSLPPIPQTSDPLQDWYNSSQVLDAFHQIHDVLNQRWREDVECLKEMKRVGSEVLWWPYTQHGVEEEEEATVVDGATGDYYSVVQPSPEHEDLLEHQPMFDATASWWTQGLGHGEPSLTLAAAAAAGRYGHVLFPSILHSPAVLLSQHLLGPRGPGNGWADKTFFTIEGSAAAEAAMKMGFRAFVKRHGDSDQTPLAAMVQEGCHHGDTLGCKMVTSPSVFNKKQHPWYETKSCCVPCPTIGFVRGKLRIRVPECEGVEAWEDTKALKKHKTIREVMDVPNRLQSDSELYEYYRQLIRFQKKTYETANNARIGITLIEPIIMGGRGMKFIDPLFQRALVDESKSSDIPVVFDEMLSGLHRLGVTSCRTILGIDPDIACYSTLLTGGVVPMSVTLASQEVFQHFLGDDVGEALLQGDAYAAYPTGCAAALHSLETFDALFSAEKETSYFEEEDVWYLSTMPLVQEAFAVGTVLSVRFEDSSREEDGGYVAVERSLPVVKKLREHDVIARQWGNAVYIMVSPLTSGEECRRLCRVLDEVVREVLKDE